MSVRVTILFRYWDTPSVQANKRETTADQFKTLQKGALR
jgi:hypothetical protein